MKYICFILAFSVCCVVLPLQADNSDLPKPVKPVFEVGVLNGKPSELTQPLIKNEFSVLAYDVETVQVKEKRQFPQKLLPNQRVAVFLKSMPTANYVLKISILSRGTEDLTKPDNLKIIFNGNDIWRRSLPHKQVIATAVIPARYIKEHSNLLQIRNAGKNDIAFDWVQLTEIHKNPGMHLVIEDLYKMKFPYRSSFSIGATEIDSGLKSTKYENSNSDDTKPHKSSTGSNISIESRLEKLDSCLKKIKEAVPKLKSKKILTESWNPVNLSLKMGIEPLIILKGSTDISDLEIASEVYKEIVFYWVIREDSKDQIEKMIETIRKNQPAAVIVTSECIEPFPFIEYVWQYPPRNEPYRLFFKKNIPIKRIMNKEIWGEWSSKDTFRPGKKALERSIYRTPLAMAEWLWAGGTSVMLHDVIDGQHFFDEYTGKPALPFYGLKRVAKLFEGNPKKHFCNVVPVANDAYLMETFWTSSENSEGIITILIASRRESGREVNVTCPLPFAGKIEYVIEKGILPDNKKTRGLYANISPLTMKKGTMDLIPVEDAKKKQTGLFKFSFPLSELITIRITKKGTKLPKGTVDLVKERFPSFKNREIVVKASKKRPNPKLVRTALRYPRGIVNIQGGDYKGSKIEASRGIIDGVENVTPWDDDSTLIEISYPSGKGTASEGACVFFGAGPEKCDYFGFWVFPRSKTKLNNVALKFYFRSSNKTHFYLCRLKTDMWQRVVIPCKDLKPPYWGNMCFVGDPNLTQYRKGNVVTFELNGFAVLGSNDRDHGETGLQSVRVEEAADSCKLFLLGKPGMYLDYRYVFKDQLAFKEAKGLAPIKGLNLFWKKEAKTLQITGQFPKTDSNYKVSDDFQKQLSDKEKTLISEKSLIPIGVVLKFVK